MTYGLRKPVQRRSAEALERLVEASIELMSEGGFDDASITEILTKANCSVGAFYGRFDSKESLFHYVQKCVLAEMDEWVADAFRSFEEDKLDARGEVDAEDVSRFLVQTLYEFYKRKPGLYRAIFMHTRIRRDPLLLKRVAIANTRVLKLAEELCTKIKPAGKDLAGKHLDRQRKWLLGFKVLAAYLREEILFAGAFPTGDAIDVGSALDELHELLLAYGRD